MAKADLTAQRLRELLDYDPAGGALIWRVRTRSAGGKAKPGVAAGSKMANGYITIGLLGKQYLAHRLAWLHATGSWPKDQIDHINGDRSDNRLCNLRDVSNQLNCENKRRALARNNSCSSLGVTYRAATRRYIAQICVNRKRMYLGSFLTEKDASDAYIAAKRKLHVGCAI